MATTKVTAIGEYKMKDSSGLEDGYELVFTGLRTEIMFSIMRIPAERVTWHRVLVDDPLIEDLAHWLALGLENRFQSLVRRFQNR
jgi:hypothetical protein